MGNAEIREPIQKRSIEKKERIIQAGFELICEKGYYNTNTAEIAKAAGVSTGIVYQYFKDKHDILIEGIRLYADSLFYPMLSISDNNKVITSENISFCFREMINKFIKEHKLSKIAHEEIMSMTHSDKEVANLFHKSEMEMTNKLTRILLSNGFNEYNLSEKVHIIIGMIDNLCHEIVYHKHKQLDYDKMIDIVIYNISNMLK
ncbi:MAG: TetR/AcrR family transcriptional regulator [Clostridia bacterium]|nr:TetR/AcrR family transcriptional regulator [Clostridia bacterium]